LIIKLYQLL